MKKFTPAVSFVLIASTVTLPVLSSTLFLTALLCVGLVFFIRAASKDRMQTVEYASIESEDVLSQQLIDYFQQRSYQPLDPNELAAELSLAEGESPTDWFIFQGLVRPSLFLAIFLTLLAVIGLLCMSLVLAVLFPQGRLVFPGLVALAPLACIFYWRKAGREERIAFKVLADENQDQEASNRSRLILQGHRDEMIQLVSNIPLEQLESAA